MWRTFSRSQIAAFIATIIDYTTLITWTDVLHHHYLYGVALGSCSGAVANFTINRHWSFEAHHEKFHGQLLRYAIVSIGSLFLNTLGVYLITEYLGFNYIISKACISISVGFFYNYPLHYFFVYKKKEVYHESSKHFSATQSEDPSPNFNPRSSQSSFM